MSLWLGEFGNDYTARQADTTQARQKIWQMLLGLTHEPQSILEVGANVGQNLQAIDHLMMGLADLYACEPNKLARGELLDVVHPSKVTSDFADNLSFDDNSMDLVFTSGVLIHVPPDKLMDSLKEIHRVSKRWIIIGEYFAPREEMIPYRGHDDAMWRRDYGSLFLDTFADVHCEACFFAWKRLTGLDNMTFWVLEKGEYVN